MHSGFKGVVKGLFFLFIAALSIAGLAALFHIAKNSAMKVRSQSPALHVSGGSSSEKDGLMNIKGIPEYDDSVCYDVPKRIDIAAGTYCDGVYRGMADGYSQGLAVDVTIAGGIVQSIVVMENHETPGFFEHVFSELGELVIQKQSTDMDAVTGATYTSHAYLAAIEDALQKAAVD